MRIFQSWLEIASTSQLRHVLNKSLSMNIILSWNFLTAKHIWNDAAHEMKSQWSILDPYFTMQTHFQATSWDMRSTCNLLVTSRGAKPWPDAASAEVFGWGLEGQRRFTGHWTQEGSQECTERMSVHSALALSCPNGKAFHGFNWVQLIFCSTVSSWPPIDDTAIPWNSEHHGFWLPKHKRPENATQQCFWNLPSRTTKPGQGHGYE